MRAWILLALVLMLVPNAGLSDLALDDLDALVGRWIELRRTMADEIRTWKAQERQWREEIRLLEAEQAELEKEMADAAILSTSLEEQRAAVLARKGNMTLALEGLGSIIDRAEPSLKQWQTRIPHSIDAGLMDALGDLPATKQEAERRPLARRVQLAAALYARIESLQHALHVTKEILPTAGSSRRQVDVLYVGLTRGFAVTADNNWAAVGVPTRNGWTWAPRPEIAPNVRIAIDVFNRRKTAQLVELPMQVSGSSGSKSIRKENP